MRKLPFAFAYGAMFILGMSGSVTLRRMGRRSPQRASSFSISILHNRSTRNSLALRKISS